MKARHLAIVLAWTLSCLPSVKAPARLGASNGGDRAASIPPSWTVPAWFFDPANETTCASDNNDCTQATCGAAGSYQGPCLTYQEIATRWGTYSPRLQQTTLITALSTQPNAGIADPIYATPYVESINGQLGFQGALGAAQQTSTGTITIVNPKTRTLGASHLLTVTYPAGAAIGNIVVNSTHPSRAWIYAASSGNFTTSQPYVASVPTGGYEGNVPWTEVDAWTTGDTVTTYAPVALNIVQFQPGPWINNGGSSAYQSGYISQINITSPGSQTSYNPCLLNTYVNVYESSFSQRGISISATPGIGRLQGQFIENSTSTWIQTASEISLYDSGIYIVGGIHATPGFTSQVASTNIGGDVIIATQINLDRGVIGIGTLTTGGTDGVYLDTNGIVQIDVRGSLTAGLVGPPALWGLGSIGTLGSARFTYQAGAGGAVAEFLNSGTAFGGALLTNLHTTGWGCVAIPTASAIGACNQTISPTTLDANLGSTAGCMFVPGGGSWCNAGE